jgi:hypothetical protein
MKFIHTVVALALVYSGSGQQMLAVPAEYNLNINRADSLYETGDFEQSAMFYTMAFKKFNWRALPEDRFKAARAFASSNQVDSALFNLHKLCSQRYWNYKLLANDNAFNKIKNRTEWKGILRCLKANKEKDVPALNIDWFNYLNPVYERDTKVRNQLRTIKDNNSKEAQALYSKMRIIDSINLLKVSGFIKDHGWRGADEVGVEGNEALFLVIQHSNTKTQEKYLPILREAVSKQQARPQSLALMEDRVSVAKNGYQIYGSQLLWDNSSGHYILSPIKDEKNVNVRRKEVGLEPLEVYLKRYYNIDYKQKINR